MKHTTRQTIRAAVTTLCLFGVIIVGVIVLNAWATESYGATAPAPKNNKPPVYACQNEDGSTTHYKGKPVPQPLPCVWSATDQGDRTGPRSVLVRLRNGHLHQTTISNTRAHRLFTYGRR